MAKPLDTWPSTWTRGRPHGQMASPKGQWPATWTDGQPHGPMASPMDKWAVTPTFCEAFVAPYLTWSFQMAPITGCSRRACLLDKRV
jgi:hypothetical protein